MFIPVSTRSFYNVKQFQGDDPYYNDVTHGSIWLTKKTDRILSVRARD